MKSLPVADTGAGVSVCAHVCQPAMRLLKAASKPAVVCVSPADAGSSDCPLPQQEQRLEPVVEDGGGIR